MHIIFGRILASTNNLVFMIFTPVCTMIMCWFVAHVDSDASLSLNLTFCITGIYHCEFLANHPTDSACSDKMSQWWPGWYRYSCSLITGDIIIGDIPLIRPWSTPYPIHIFSGQILSKSLRIALCCTHRLTLNSYLPQIIYGATYLCMIGSNLLILV